MHTQCWHIVDTIHNLLLVSHQSGNHLVKIMKEVKKECWTEYMEKALLRIFQKMSLQMYNGKGTCIHHTDE